MTAELRRKTTCIRQPGRMRRFDDEGEYDVELGREGEVPARMALSVAPQAKGAAGILGER